MIIFFLIKVILLFKNDLTSLDILNFLLVLLCLESQNKYSLMILFL